MISGLERAEGRGVPEGFSEVSPELTDLVAICNEAARVQRGNVVWLSWNAAQPEQKRNVRGNRVSYGSTMLGFTAAGARYLLDRTGRTKPGHIDVWLMNQMNGELPQQQCGACLVCPPIGGFSDKHVSMNLAGAVRSHAWARWWSQSGTRELPGRTCSHGGGYRVRELISLEWSGEPRVYARVPLASGSMPYVWITQRPPRSLDLWTQDAQLRDMLVSRGWIEYPSGAWCGPFGRADGQWGFFHGVAHAQAEGREPAQFLRDLAPTNALRVLQEDPEGMSATEALSESNGQLTNVMTWLVTEPEPAQDGANSQRWQRQRRARVDMYRKRCFQTAWCRQVV